jgi:UDP-N-acetylglucosamine 4,6-dehydratase/5-epimerase
MKIFKDKILMITGGTGSFGKAMVKKIYESDIKEIRIFSRDEKKQDDMRKFFNSPKLKFYIGDVRDRDSLDDAVRNVDFIFHAAALKQVPSCEFYPMEAVKTNVGGTNNLLDAAINNSVKKVICLSTDKAVYPINAMGISKALMEKVAISKSRNLNNSTIICTTRYGNVMGSRGSVIPLFKNQIELNNPITITNPDMTRFMMTLDDAIELVLYAFANGNSGDIFVQKSPAASINILYKSIISLMNASEHPIEKIGTRHGEKLFEVLCSTEEMLRAQDLGEYFRIPSDSRDLNYALYFEEGALDINKTDEYNSHNTTQLGLNEMKALLERSNLLKSSGSL